MARIQLPSRTGIPPQATVTDGGQWKPQPRPQAQVQMPQAAPQQQQMMPAAAPRRQQAPAPQQPIAPPPPAAPAMQGLMAASQEQEAGPGWAESGGGMIAPNLGTRTPPDMLRILSQMAGRIY